MTHEDALLIIYAIRNVGTAIGVMGSAILGVLLLAFVFGWGRQS
jgi:hypothetical protein